MTRAKKELYLCHARLREFRGQLNYAIPSSFLQELPRDGASSSIRRWRGTTRAARRTSGGRRSARRRRTGPTPARGRSFRRRSPTELKPTIPDAPETGLAVGVLVQHEEYGIGQVTDVSGFGALRKVKIRFPGHGEKTFVADKVRLKIVGRKKAGG